MPALTLEFILISEQSIDISPLRVKKFAEPKSAVIFTMSLASSSTILGKENDQEL
jgi:hypothetical protein